MLKSNSGRRVRVESSVHCSCSCLLLLFSFAHSRQIQENGKMNGCMRFVEVVYRKRFHLVGQAGVPGPRPSLDLDPRGQQVCQRRTREVSRKRGEGRTRGTNQASASRSEKWAEVQSGSEQVPPPVSNRQSGRSGSKGNTCRPSLMDDVDTVAARGWLLLDTGDRCSALEEVWRAGNLLRGDDHGVGVDVSWTGASEERASDK